VEAQKDQIEGHTKAIQDIVKHTEATILDMRNTVE
jgi:hypothetical protein